MAARNVPLYVGAHGTVIAINRDTGDVLWTSELKGGEFVDVMIADGDLFAASKGRLYRLDPATGDVLWRNDLPGMGWGIVSIAGSHRSGAADKLRQDQAAATTAVIAAS
jgi:outer membrane protein assembly factor BamB